MCSPGSRPLHSAASPLCPDAEDPQRHPHALLSVPVPFVHSHIYPLRNSVSLSSDLRFSVSTPWLYTTPVTCMNAPLPTSSRRLFKAHAIRSPCRNHADRSKQTRAAPSLTKNPAGVVHCPLSKSELLTRPWTSRCTYFLPLL